MKKNDVKKEEMTGQENLIPLPEGQPVERRLNVRTPAPGDIEEAFREEIERNPLTRSVQVRGMALAKVPFPNQHDLAAEVWLFEDGGAQLGAQYGWEHGATLLWDGHHLEARRVTKRPTDGYRIFSVARQGSGKRPRLERLSRAMVLAFMGTPDKPGLLVRHLQDRKEDNTALGLAYGTPSDNAFEYHQNKARTEGRTSIVLIPTGHAQEARARLGLRGQDLNELMTWLLRGFLDAA